MAPTETIEVKIPALPTWVQRLLMVVAMMVVQIWQSGSTQTTMREDFKSELARLEERKERDVEDRAEERRWREQTDRAIRVLEKQNAAIMSALGIKMKEQE